MLQSLLCIFPIFLFRISCPAHCLQCKYLYNFASLELQRFSFSHQRFEPFLEVLHRQILTVPLLQTAVDCLRWDENTAHYLNDPIGSNAVFDCDGGEAVDLDLNEASISAYIDAERLIFQQGLEVNLNSAVSTEPGGAEVSDTHVEVSLRNTILFNICRLGFVEGIRVQCLIGNNVVLQESLEILLTILAEEEAIDPSTELLECEVGWRKDGPTKMGRSIVYTFEQTSLGETKLEGAELAWKELDDIGRFWWGN